ncbi:hypothetical protein RB195_016948 [Necator americanus]|uniref:C2 NT-type domain-containing protein n=1 Tax=Necator americanus TaxID=51031 RepID=A0ABR1C5D7_NECAM
MIKLFIENRVHLPLSFCVDIDVYSSSANTQQIRFSLVIDDEDDDDYEKEEVETGTDSQVTDHRRTFASPFSLLPSPPEVGLVKSDDGGDGSGSNGGDDSGDSSNSSSDRLVTVDEPAKGTAPPTSSTPQS